MDKRDLTEAAAWGERAVDLLTPILELAVPYAKRTMMKSNNFRALVQKVDQSEDEQERDWASTILLSYIFTTIFHERKGIEKFLRKFGKELEPEQHVLINGWKKNPVRFMLGRMGKVYGSNLVSVTDIFTLEEQPVYVPFFEEQLSQNPELTGVFLIFLYHNGLNLQIFNMSPGYVLPEEDFSWYVEGFRAMRGTHLSLTSLIVDNFYQFFSLEALFDKEPEKEITGEAMCFHWAEFPLNTAEIDTLPGVWERETSQELELYVYKNLNKELRKIPPSPELIGYNLNPAKKQLWEIQSLVYPELYVDRKNQKVLLFAYSRYDFFLLRELLQLVTEESLKAIVPEGSVTNELYLLALRIEGFSLPYTRYIEPFLYSGSSEQVEERSANYYEQLVDDVSSGRTLGPQWVEEFMEEYELDEHELEEVILNLKKVIDLDIKPFAFPEGEAAALFTGSEGLNSNICIFFILAGEKNLRIWPGDTEAAYEIFCTLVTDEQKQLEFQEDPYRYIESCFSAIENSTMLFHAFCSLLALYGDQWFPVRTYGLELVKWYFPLVLDEDEEYEPFIEEFSKVVYQKLCRNGICSVKEIPKGVKRRQGLYEIRMSELVPVLFPLSWSIIEPA